MNETELTPLPDPDFLLDSGRLRCYYGGTVANLLAAERERRTNLAADFAEYLYRVASQVPFEHAAWANERGAALLAALKA